VTRDGRPVLFFFGAMSPYSWFAAERIGALIPDARWRPGVFGVPTFVVGDRLFWGDDRLEDAARAAAA
jgi:2-hydroxychromene-2-carboxylate isomerase